MRCPRASRGAPRRHRGRALQVPHGAARVVPALEVGRELHGDLVRPLAEGGRLALGDPPVDLDAAARRHLLVHDLLVQPVAEPVPPRHRPVGPGVGAAGDEERLAPGQGRARRLDVGHLGGGGAGGDDGGRELQAGNAGDLQHPPVPALEPAELQRDHAAHVLGDRDLHRPQALGHEPALGALDESAAADQVLHRARHEERVALRPAMDQPGERRALGGLVPGGPEAAQQVLSHRRFVEKIERDLTTATVQEQLVPDARQRGPAAHHVGGPVGAEHEEPGGPGPPRHVGEPVERGGVAPVQVLEPESDRRLRRQRLDRLGQLAQHPLPHGARRRPLERPQLGGADQRRHLRQPRRRVAPEDGNDGAPRFAPQAREGLEQRQVGLARPVVLDAATGGDEQPVAGGAGQEGLHRRRLADARLARDEDDLALAAPGAIQARAQLRQRALAAHDVIGPPEARAHRRRVRHRRDEPVTPPVDGLDVARAPGVVAQRVPDLLDAGGERRVAHRHAGPDGREEVVLAHERPGPADQGGQHRRRLRRQPDLPRAPPEGAARRLERVAAEADRPIPWQFPHPALPEEIPDLSRDFATAEAL